MNYGLYLSAAGALTSLHRQDIYANNLANVNTPGFKPDMVFTRQRLPERLESPHLPADPQWLLEQLGGGQLVDPTYASLGQGILTRTANPLDLAIEGDGFFVVSADQGAAASNEDIRLTRDGRFTLSPDGTLVMAATGMPALDVNNEVIRLDPSGGDVVISETGEIEQNGQVVARLQVVSPTDPTLLEKVGDNLLKFRDSEAARVPATGRIEQGFIEGSAVDAIKAMNAMIGASKAVSTNATMIRYHDQVMGQAINTFGRVA